MRLRKATEIIDTIKHNRQNRNKCINISEFRKNFYPRPIKEREKMFIKRIDKTVFEHSRRIWYNRSIKNPECYMNNKKLNNLLAALQEGDNEAFSEIYQGTAQTVFAFILTYTGNRAAAEDLTQDTFMKVKKNADGYKKDTNATAWLLQIAKNLALNWLKKRKKETLTDFADDKGQYGSYRLEKDYPVLDAVRQCLKEEERQIVLLHIIAGYKHREIAAITGKPLGTVLWTYKSSLAKLKACLESEGSK